MRDPNEAHDPASDDAAAAAASAERQAWDEGRADDELELERRHRRAANDMDAAIRSHRIFPGDNLVLDVAPGYATVTGVATNDPTVAASVRVLDDGELAEARARWAREVIRPLVADQGGEALARILHEHVETELRQLRHERDDLNARIRALVEEERVLGLAVTRFDRLADDRRSGATIDPTNTEPEEG